ncbi:hypothetical protein H5410_001536, partial [Solanum commersonii]
MLVVLVVMMAAWGSAMATVYQVGDLAGWTFNYNYNELAFFKQFQAGDTLAMTFFGKTMLVVLMVVMAASGSAMATVYQVGDLAGFNYDPQLHNVMQVDINDYNSCTASNPLATFNSGSDSITLDTPDGDYFFICGIPGHCASGLKLHIKVIPTTTTPPPPPTTMNNRYPDHFLQIKLRNLTLLQALLLIHST